MTYGGANELVPILGMWSCTFFWGMHCIKCFKLSFQLWEVGINSHRVGSDIYPRHDRDSGHIASPSITDSDYLELSLACGTFLSLGRHATNWARSIRRTEVLCEFGFIAIAGELILYPNTVRLKKTNLKKTSYTITVKWFNRIIMRSNRNKFGLS